MNFRLAAVAVCGMQLKGSVLCSDNYIGALGAAVIANALKKNKSLRELHMKGNELGDEGVKALCGALKERQSPITSLDFGNNKCGRLSLPLEVWKHMMPFAPCKHAFAVAARGLPGRLIASSWGESLVGTHWEPMQESVRPPDSMLAYLRSLLN